MSLISLHFFQRYQEKLDKAIKDYVASHSANSITNQEDVSISNPVDGQLLKYSASLKKWINATGGGGSATTLEELTDVDITDVQNGQVVKWDATNQKWVNGAGGGSGTVDHINDIGDVNITSVANGQTLIYDDTTNKWKNGSPQVANISDVQDINITNVTNGQALVYDSATSKWVNSNVATSLVELGIAYATCSTAAATATKQVTVTNYNLTANSIIIVKFTNSVPSSAKLQINSITAKNIYYKGSSILAGTINGGDTATMIYDGTQFNVIAIDNEVIKLIQTLSAGSTSITFSSGAITADAFIEVYTDNPKLDYSNITVNGTSVTITYDAQSSSTQVMLLIRR